MGVRGEAVNGFKTALDVGLPALRTMKSKDKNYSYVYALTCLMANTDDTNVISRSGIDGLRFMQEEASKLLLYKGDELINKHNDFNKILIEKNISPGGCADLLAISLFLYELENYNG